jgi:DNA repair protein RecO (recombination protein O)
LPTITDTAICIRRWDFSETSQTVSLFTRQYGVIRGLAKGAKREKGNFSGGLDVLTRGEVVAIVKPGKDLATITAWHLQDMYRHLRHHLAANRAALYMVDLVHHMLMDHDPHPHVFDVLEQSLRNLCDLSAIEPALLRLQWAVLGETGYLPELHRDAQTGTPLPLQASTLAFSTSAGGVVADTAAGDRWRVRRETIEVLRQVAAGELTVGTDMESVRRANRLLAVHFREIIGSEPPAMRWAFSDLMP